MAAVKVSVVALEQLGIVPAARIGKGAPMRSWKKVSVASQTGSNLLFPFASFASRALPQVPRRFQERGREAVC
jgi:hypothetical protein